MGLFDSIKNFMSGAQSKLPEDLNSIGEIKDKASSFAQDHGVSINKAVDGLQDKIPGTKGDGVVDSAQEKLEDLSKKQ